MEDFSRDEATLAFRQDGDGENPQWDGFLQRSTPQDLSTVGRGHCSAIAGMRLLITGAGGWIGFALAEALEQAGARELVLLDTSEAALYRATQTLAETGAPVRHVAVLASVCDSAALDEVFARYRPEIVYHAAAFKHVPLMEAHPFAAVANNALGTLTLASVAEQHGCERMVLVSTDKAADPLSIMGASKRLAEFVMLTPRPGTTHKSAVRLGNVLGSSGSVVPLFLGQIARGGPVTVAHPGVRRYFMTLTEAVEALLVAIEPGCPGGLLAPDPGAPIRVLDLANYLIDRGPRGEVPIVFTSLRPGDKMEESLIAANERWEKGQTGILRAIQSPVPSSDMLDAVFSTLRKAVGLRDLPLLIETVLRLVPAYQPSGLLREQIAAIATVSA